MEKSTRVTPSRSQPAVASPTSARPAKIPCPPNRKNRNLFPKTPGFPKAKEMPPLQIHPGMGKPSDRKPKNPLQASPHTCRVHSTMDASTGWKRVPAADPNQSHRRGAPRLQDGDRVRVFNARGETNVAAASPGGSCRGTGHPQALGRRQNGSDSGIASTS